MLKIRRIVFFLMAIGIRLHARNGLLREFHLEDKALGKKVEIKETKSNEWQAKVVFLDQSKIYTSKANKNIAFADLFRDLQLDIDSWPKKKTCASHDFGRVEWAEVSRRSYTFCSDNLIDHGRMNRLLSKLRYMEAKRD